MDSNVTGHRKRLRQKYSESGYESLLDYEKIELLLTYIIPRKDVKPIAKELLEKYKNLEGIVKASDELINIKGIGESGATYFKLVGDVAKALFKEEYLNKDIMTISGTKDLVSYLRNDIGNSRVEEFKVIFLDTGNNLLGDEVLFSGTIDKSAIYMREVVERIIHYNAKSIILSHNHPSGSLKPSKADIDITLKLKKLLDTLEVRLLDHIIITKDSYYSLLEEGIIELGG